MLICTALALVFSLAIPSANQQTLTSPYREQLTSEIRGLTANEIADLREGRGMALARAAELNGYPGPSHLLDGVKTGELRLSPYQLTAIQRLFQEMSAKAKRIGNAILEEEQALETTFRTGTVDAANLRESVGRIATLQAELRVVHLRTHLHTRALLTDKQIEQYDEMRGYTESSSAVPDLHKH